MGLAIANVELADGDEWMDGWVNVLMITVL